jgi:hypothetical protein
VLLPSFRAALAAHDDVGERVKLVLHVLHPFLVLDPESFVRFVRGWWEEF